MQMMRFENKKKYLQEYNGKPLNLMEVCGSHTAAISKYGVRDILSEQINLISGPGCPVCVTPTAYIDRLIELAMEDKCTVVTFGDLMRVPGSVRSLGQARSQGAKVTMVYSPMDTLKLAEGNPHMQYVFAAVGFETTAPVYALLLEEIIKNKIPNICLLTAIKTMPPIIHELLSQRVDNTAGQIDGFIAPGHVCAVMGSDIFIHTAHRFRVPFAVSGFGGEELIDAIYGLVKMCEDGRYDVENYYLSVVNNKGNLIAQEKMNKYFVPYDCVWRGMGVVKASGLMLRDEYTVYDAGSIGLNQDIHINRACRCGEILSGTAKPSDCPLFGRICTPDNPQGACMVSMEGSCYHSYRNS